MTGATGVKNSKYYIYRADGASGQLEVTPNKIKTNDEKADVYALSVVLEGQTSGQLIFSFVDKMGVKVDATLDYQKNAPETAE